MNRGWMLSAHTLQTRQIINSLIRKSEMWVPEGGDPISAYLVHLETKAISQTSESHKTRISADASAVADCLLKNGVRTVDRRNDCDVRGLKKSVERVLISARLPPSWE
jgi:hypothetical protein